MSESNPANCQGAAAAAAPSPVSKSALIAADTLQALPNKTNQQIALVKEGANQQIALVKEGLPLWAKDLIAGTIGGVAGIVAGQPADTIKVRMQTSAVGVRSGVLESVAACWRKEGLRGFYKGLLAPCASNAPINAIVFTSYGTVTRALDERDPGNVEMSRATKEMIAGGAGGLIQTLFSSPAELIKITQQVQRSKAQASTAECAARIVRANGITGLYHGAAWTAMRDTPAFAVYFYSYERCKLWMSGGGEAGMLTQLMAGGIAGTLSWGVTQPVDVVKSCVQMQSALPAAERRPAAAIVAEGVRREGARQFFFRGFAPTLLRAFPVSAVTFCVYESIFKRM